MSLHSIETTASKLIKVLIIDKQELKLVFNKQDRDSYIPLRKAIRY